MRTRKINNVGLRWNHKTFFWTLVQPDQYDATRHLQENVVTLDIEDGAASDPVALGAQLRRQCPELTGSVSVILPFDAMLLRVMELPVADAEDMDSMIRLQMDKCSPFPDDQMAISYEVLRADTERCLVLMAGVQKNTVEFATTMLSATDLKLRRIDAEAALWWHLIQKQNITDETDGRQVFTIAEANRVLVITTQNGRPAACNQLNIPSALSAPDYAAELIHEIQNITLALDLELTPAPLSAIYCWTDSPTAGEWSQTLNKHFRCSIELQPLSTLTPLTALAAQRITAPPFQPQIQPVGAHSVIDFTPVAWRIAASTRRLRRRLTLAAALTLTVLGIIAGVFTIGSHLEAARTRRLEALLQTLKQPAEEVRTLQRKVRSFELSLARGHWALETLREISSLLPPAANISSFQFKRGRSVILRGEAETVTPIYDFKQALDAARMFRNVEMGSVQPAKRKNTTVQTFQMTILLPEEAP